MQRFSTRKHNVAYLIIIFSAIGNSSSSKNIPTKMVTKHAAMVWAVFAVLLVVPPGGRGLVVKTSGVAAAKSSAASQNPEDMKALVHSECSAQTDYLKREIAKIRGAEIGKKSGLKAAAQAMVSAAEDQKKKSASHPDGAFAPLDSPVEAVQALSRRRNVIDTQMKAAAAEDAELTLARADSDAEEVLLIEAYLEKRTQQMKLDQSFLKAVEQACQAAMDEVDATSAALAAPSSPDALANKVKEQRHMEKEEEQEEKPEPPKRLEALPAAPQKNAQALKKDPPLPSFKEVTEAATAKAAAAAAETHRSKVAAKFRAAAEAAVAAKKLEAAAGAVPATAVPAAAVPAVAAPEKSAVALAAPSSASEKSVPEQSRRSSGRGKKRDFGKLHQFGGYVPGSGLPPVEEVTPDPLGKTWEAAPATISAVPVGDAAKGSSSKLRGSLGVQPKLAPPVVSSSIVVPSASQEQTSSLSGGDGPNLENALINHWDSFLSEDEDADNNAQQHASPTRSRKIVLFEEPLNPAPVLHRIQTVLLEESETEQQQLVGTIAAAAAQKKAAAVAHGFVGKEAQKLLRALEDPKETSVELAKLQLEAQSLLRKAETCNATKGTVTAQLEHELQLTQEWDAMLRPLEIRAQAMSKVVPSLEAQEAEMEKKVQSWGAQWASWIGVSAALRKGHENVEESREDKDAHVRTLKSITTLGKAASESLRGIREVLAEAKRASQVFSEELLVYRDGRLGAAKRRLSKLQANMTSTCGTGKEADDLAAGLTPGLIRRVNNAISEHKKEEEERKKAAEAAATAATAAKARAAAAAMAAAAPHPPQQPSAEEKELNSVFGAVDAAAPPRSSPQQQLQQPAFLPTGAAASQQVRRPIMSPPPGPPPAAPSVAAAGFPPPPVQAAAAVAVGAAAPAVVAPAAPSAALLPPSAVPAQAAAAAVAVVPAPPPFATTTAAAVAPPQPAPAAAPQSKLEVAKQAAAKAGADLQADANDALARLDGLLNIHEEPGEFVQAISRPATLTAFTSLSTEEKGDLAATAAVAAEGQRAALSAYRAPAQTEQEPPVPVPAPVAEPAAPAVQEGSSLASKLGARAASLDNYFSSDSNVVPESSSVALVAKGGRSPSQPPQVPQGSVMVDGIAMPLGGDDLLTKPQAAAAAPPPMMVPAAAALATSAEVPPLPAVNDPASLIAQREWAQSGMDADQQEGKAGLGSFLAESSEQGQRAEGTPSVDEAQQASSEGPPRAHKKRDLKKEMANLDDLMKEISHR